MTAIAFFKRLCNGVTIFPRCTPMDGLRRGLVTGTGATLDEHAQGANEDRQAAAFDNSAPQNVLRLQARCGQ